MKFPKISVIMAVYNSEKFLNESINSILNQTFKDFEFIIINDCSTDNSLKIIKEFIKKDNRIKLINNERNLGAAGTRNEGLKIAKGKYIAILDSDDISYTQRFVIQYNYLEDNPHIFLVGSSAIYINENGKEIRKFRKYDDYKMLAWRLPKSCSIIHSCVMFKNEGFLYKEEFESVEDYKLFLELLSQGKNLTNLPQFLIKYRVHKGSMSIYNKKKQEFFGNKVIEENTFKGKFKLRFLFKLFFHYITTRNEKKIIKKEDFVKEILDE